MDSSKFGDKYFLIHKEDILEIFFLFSTPRVRNRFLETRIPQNGKFLWKSDAIELWTVLGVIL